MTSDEFDFLPLKVTHIDEGGRRCFDPEGKRRLIEACEQPGASVAGLALKAGVNANQLRKWILLERRRAVRSDCVELPGTGTAEFVPVVEVADARAVRANSRPSASGAVTPMPRAREVTRPSQRPPLPSRLVAQLPNGVSLELECTQQETALLTAMIDALRSR
ncbi:IS66-like element accessory protein TnpA [Paraburkholderia youngii]|uniref:IS66-like element accessory protein TnpA n=1 Tax=Paraburkholderia youngii TaxID=2782701 RepID=UPI0015912933|nr:transposase [Paraburkholderia youngii]NUX58478.1 transposase [Paraburkholderia youngii]